MPRTDSDGRTVRLSVSRLLGRAVLDSEIANALDLPASTYSKRKDKPDFPTFTELHQIAEHLGVDETILHVDFGYIDVTRLNSELQQRYASYRNAIDVIASMRHDPGHATTATEDKAGSSRKANARTGSAKQATSGPYEPV
jgi:uncharacterized membrane-anchored protein YjiN (DUF445 family)